MYFILLNKLRLDQITCSGRSGTRCQHGVPKWYAIVKRLGTPAIHQLDCLIFESKTHETSGFAPQSRTKTLNYLHSSEKTLKSRCPRRDLPCDFFRI